MDRSVEKKKGGPYGSSVLDHDCQRSKRKIICMILNLPLLVLALCAIVPNVLMTMTSAVKKD